MIKTYIDGVLQESGGAGAVDSVNGQTGTVVLTQDNVADGTTYKQYSATEKTKLSGIATGAQVNTSKVKASATDTTEGYLGDKLVAGTNVTITKNNSGASETYTIASTGGAVAVDYNVANAYSKGTLVNYTDKLVYKANDDIPANTAWAIGTTGATWALVGGGESDIREMYDFYPLDYGCGSAVIEYDGKGAVLVGNSNKFTSASSNYQITCNEMKSGGKLMEIDLNDMFLNPVIFLASNGSFVVQDSAFRAISIQFTGFMNRLTINSHIGSTSTVLETINFAAPSPVGYKLLLSIYGNRITYIMFDKISGRISSNHYIEIDLSSYGTMNGFSSSTSLKYIRYSNMEFGDLLTYGKHIIFGGDSLTAGTWVGAGQDVMTKFLKIAHKKPVYAIGTGVSGRRAQAIIDNFATEVVAKKSAYAENIYILHIGINDVFFGDSPSVILNKIDQIVTLAKNAGFKVLVQTLTVFSESYRTGVLGVNAGLRERFENNNFEYFLDTYDAKYDFIFNDMLKRQYSLSDNLHYTVDFNEELAKAIDDILQIPSINTGKKTGETKDVSINQDQLSKLDSTATGVIYDRGKTYTVAGGIVSTTGNSTSSIVASSATITAPISGVFHISGTNNISTINIPYTGFIGQISIIPDGIFTFDTAGNIAEAYTATVNRAIVLTYDGTKWYRVNS